MHTYRNGSLYGDWSTADSKRYWDDKQELFDYIGTAPVIGEVFDLANAGISIVRGNYGDAALSLSAMVPVGGNLATIIKIQKHHIIPKAVYRKAGKALQKL